MPEVVSGTFPFTFSAPVFAGVVAESAEVVVLLLLLQAIRKVMAMVKAKSFFMLMVLVNDAITLPTLPLQILQHYLLKLVSVSEHPHGY